MVQERRSRPSRIRRQPEMNPFRMSQSHPNSRITVKPRHIAKFTLRDMPVMHQNQRHLRDISIDFTQNSTMTATLPYFPAFRVHFSEHRVVLPSIFDRWAAIEFIRRLRLSLALRICLTPSLTHLRSLGILYPTKMVGDTCRLSQMCQTSCAFSFHV